MRRSPESLLETDRIDFGRLALYFDGIPIIVDENQPDNGNIAVEEIGELKTKDTALHCITWYEKC